MSLLSSLLRPLRPAVAPRALYAAVVERARQPHWYSDGQVPDTIDGRFDMVAAILSLVMLRLEALHADEDNTRLAETFVTDMDGQLRQIGIGDLVVGKHIGRMMGALGGRLGAYRDALAGAEPLEAALARNLWRGDPPSEAAIAHVAAAMRAFATGLDARDLSALRAGDLPDA